MRSPRQVTAAYPAGARAWPTSAPRWPGTSLAGIGSPRWSRHPSPRCCVGDGRDPVAGVREPGLGADLLLPGSDRAGEPAGSAGVPGRELTQPGHFRIGFCQFEQQRIAGGERLHFRVAQGGVPDVIDVTAGRSSSKDLADESGFPFQGLPHK